MNWFERYGFVGMFFVVMTFIWFSLLFPYRLNLVDSTHLPHLLRIVIATGGLAVLPCGYLITILQKQIFYKQCKYLKCLIPPPIHKEMWAKMTCFGQSLIENAEIKNDFLDKIDEKIIEDESKLECVLAFHSRIHTLEEGNQRLADFMRKRFDVISINHGFIWTVVLSPFVAILLNMLSWNKFGSTASWCKSYCYFFGRISLPGAIKVLLLLFLSVCIIILLKKSIVNYANQMIEVFARKMSWKKIDDQNPNELMEDKVS